MRFTSVFFFSALVSLTACSLKGDDEDQSVSGVMVFGVTQRTDRATGGTVTTAGYEYMTIGWDKWSFGPLVASRQFAPVGCTRLDMELKPTALHVGDGGRAYFRDGALGDAPLFVEANAPDSTFGGTAFDPARRLRFGVERGFGLPKFDPVEVPTPNATLQVTSPSSETEVAVDTGDDLAVTWTADGDATGVVMVRFDADGGERRTTCGFREAEGRGVVPAEHLRGLGGGTMTIASYRNQVVTAERWIIEVVATAVASEQRFVVRSN
jgi:hypothetical protein